MGLLCGVDFGVPSGLFQDSGSDFKVRVMTKAKIMSFNVVVRNTHSLTITDDTQCELHR